MSRGLVHGLLCNIIHSSGWHGGTPPGFSVAFFCGGKIAIYSRRFATSPEVLPLATADALAEAMGLLERAQGRGPPGSASPQELGFF